MESYNNSVPVEKVGHLNNIISVVIAVVTTLGAGWVWFDSKMDDILNSQVKPYQEVLVGLAFQQSSNDEEAIKYFYKALIELEKDNTANLSAIVDPLLDSLATVDKPHRYILEFNKALELSNEKMQFSGDRFNSIAWVYWSHGKYLKAREYFNRSINYFIQEENEDLAGNSYYGAFLTHVVDGTQMDNLYLYDKSWKFDYSSYNPGEVVNNPIYEFYWMEPLMGIYKNFTENYDVFLNQTREFYDVEPLKYKKT